MSGSISFSTIPADLRVPLFWAEFDDPRRPQHRPARLLIGQKTLAGAAAELTYVPTADQVAELCGTGSQIAMMKELARQ